MLVLAPPVPGPVVRAFHYAGSPFQRGLHRGVDFGARPGTPVAAPCSGTVAYAGPTAVTLVCAGKRVTLLPVAGVVARQGATVRAGSAVARVRGRDGLHLGVRRAGDPFGYVDPELFLRRPATVAPPVAGPPGRRVRPPALPAPRPLPVPAAGTAQPLAPWPAWAGLALVLAGTRVRRRRRAARTRPAPARASPELRGHVS